MDPSIIAEKRAQFRSMHREGCFVIPNPWDIGSARYLEHLGFTALASTSGGLAFSRGLPDGGAITRDIVLAHLAEMVAATRVPLNADFEAGYAKTAEGVAESVQLCLETGVAGLSIEDATGDPSRPLFPLEEALDRFRAARHAVDASGCGAMLTARAECFLVHHPDPLAESIRRLQAYSDAGADVLFAPGVTSASDIKTLVSAVSPKPVNLIVTRDCGLSVRAIADMGVRRISVGSTLARAAWRGFMRAAEGILRNGDFTSFNDLVPFPEINGLFRDLNK
jgi:2-methylisocitrate lyase-like PEP mutase family enzyme